MSVSHVAGTGTVTPIAEGPAADVAYVGVAAGRRAMLTVAMKFSTTTFAAVDGWTALASVAGGTGTEGGGDNAPTRVGVWYRDLDGTESGTVVVSGSVTADSIQGVMDVYESSTGAWVDPVVVSGDDAVHDGTRSVTTGSLTTAADDVLHAGIGSDTDNAGVLSSLAIAPAGATVGATTQRSRHGSTTLGDVGVITADVTVSAGATGAVTVGFTRGTADCGPIVVTRLRSADVDPVPSGTGAATAGVALVASGGKRTRGAGVLPTANAAPEAGRGSMLAAGAGAALAEATALAAGVPVAVGAGVAPVAVAVAGAGVRRAVGAGQLDADVSTLATAPAPPMRPGPRLVVSSRTAGRVVSSDSGRRIVT